MADGPRSLWPSSYALMDTRGPERERDYQEARWVNREKWLEVMRTSARLVENPRDQTSV